MVLAIILIVCFTVLLIVAMTYFYGSSKSEYGDRLDGLKDVKITDNFIKDTESSIESKEQVSDVTIINKGKLIYISIDYVEGTTLEVAKNLASEAVTLFSDEQLENYDLNFTISSDNSENGFALMGARNSGGSGMIVWNNNTPVPVAESEEE